MSAVRVRVGLRPPRSLFQGRPGDLRAMVERAEAGGIDRLCVGDHVSFRGGQGNDGLVEAAALAALSRTATVATAVYQLPLRHPVPVARQVATLAGMATGRFEFGVGVGGEDRAEFRACEVDPATRGSRMDEALEIVRRLLAGERLTFRGRHFDLSEAVIAPVPTEPVPLLVGGRSTAALRRVAEQGDGWLAMWVSPRRFLDGVGEVTERAMAAGRDARAWRHCMHVFCAFGRDRESAEPRLAGWMEDFYGTSFDRFERYCPAGTPEDVAESLRPYAEAGCSDFNLVPFASTWQEAVDGTAAVRELLRAASTATASSAHGQQSQASR